MSRDIFNESFKGGYHLPGLLRHEFVADSKGKLLKRILHDRLKSEMYGMGILRNDKLFGIIDKKMQQLYEAGIIQNCYADFDIYSSTKYYERFEESEKPKVLTHETLEAGFVIWLVTILFSIIAFICEWLIKAAEFFMIKTLVVNFTN